MIKTHIRTRGLSCDYRYIPEKPSKESQLSKYESKSDLQYPTCILDCSQEKSSFLFLSGIPSKRRDNGGTSIRYDLLITFDPSELKQVEKNQLNSMVRFWLEDVKSALVEDQFRLPKAGQLGKLLDETFSEKDWEDLLNLASSNPQSPELLKKLNFQNFIPSLSPQQQFPHNLTVTSDKLWWGGINNEISCQRWLLLVRKLLQGEVEGKALLLNIATPKSLHSLFTQNEEIGVLLAKQSSEDKPNKVQLQSNPPGPSSWLIRIWLIGLTVAGITFFLLYFMLRRPIIPVAENFIHPYIRYISLKVEKANSKIKAFIRNQKSW